MAMVRHTAEQIIGKMREMEVILAQGGSAAQGCKAIGVTEQTYYRWRKELGGPKVKQAKRLKELPRGNARLRKAIADLTPEKLISQEAARGNF
jgi:putative transposase